MKTNGIQVRGEAFEISLMGRPGLAVDVSSRFPMCAGGSHKVFNHNDHAAYENGHVICSA